MIEKKKSLEKQESKKGQDGLPHTKDTSRQASQPSAKQSDAKSLKEKISQVKMYITKMYIYIVT